MSRLFLCNTCGKDTLTSKCECGAIIPNYALEPRKLPTERPDWLKEVERHIDDP